MPKVGLWTCSPPGGEAPLKTLIDNVPAGPPGSAGPQGEQGPPFAQAVVDGVTTLPPGDDATVEVSFDGTEVHFTFGIPRGDDGSPGEQGPPGEVTPTQLDEAVAGTALNPGGIGPWTGSFSDPPTPAEMQDFAAWVESLRVAITR
jgi:hypothetical protein